MQAVDEQNKTSARARYERLKEHRQPFLDRARQCSELTIPTLIPPEGHGRHTVYTTPWQALGARGVTNLASKMLLSLLPPNTPFSRLMMNDASKAQMAGDNSLKSKVDEAIAAMERIIQQEIESSALRNPANSAFLHLIVGGNALMVLPKEGVRVFGLDSFVVDRDSYGNVLEVITVEKVSPLTLDPDITELINQDVDKKKEDSKVEDVEVYTRYYLKRGRWQTFQEINGIIIPGSTGSWPKGRPPFIAMRWTRVEGESYGRSHVEHYMGDLIALEALSKAQVQSAAIAAKTVFLVNPNGITDVDDLSKAESGDFVAGTPDDVHALQIEKYHDLQVTEQAIQRISERLAFAFLLQSAVQRQGERVTAEEIRYMAGELEDALGGVYSLMAAEFQLPLVKRIMDRLEAEKKLPRLPDGVVSPTVVTGMEALGRGHDAQRLMLFLQSISQLPEAVQYINVNEVLSRLATAQGIDPAGLIKTQEQIQAEQQAAMQAQQQQQMMDIAGRAAPQAVKVMGDAYNNSNTQG